MRVAVSGAAGRMGSLVAETVDGVPDLELHGCFDPVGSGSVAGVPISGDPSVVEGAEVVVEFTRPDVVLENLERWRRMGVHAVVGTSGFDEERLGTVRRSWASGPPNCIVVPNFSIGAVLMMRFAEEAAPHFAASEVVELHHDRKVDAPSGTATSTAERIAASGGRQEREVASSEATPGVRGGTVSGVPVHSVRLPGLLAHQEVVFGSPGEVLTIRHDSTDRISFMPGVLLAVRAIPNRPGVTVGLDPLIG